jgi:N-acetylmuramoyl-L-alanine amidase
MNLNKRIRNRAILPPPINIEPVQLPATQKPNLSNFCLIVIVCLFPHLIFSQNTQKLKVIYPRENATIRTSDSMFVFGNYADTNSRIIVNGQRARQFRNKTFVAMIPVQAGHFFVTAHAVGNRDTVSLQRKVYVPPYYLENTPGSLAIDTSFFEIFEDAEIRRGDKLTFFMKGTPRSRAAFSVAGIVQNVRMRELNPKRNYSWSGSIFKRGEPPFLPKIYGIYAGTFELPENVPTGKMSLQFTLSKTSGDTITASPKAVFLVREKDFHRTAIVKYLTDVTDESGESPVSVKFAPGTEVSMIGRVGNFYRLALSKTKVAWMSADRLLVPTGLENQIAGKIAGARVRNLSEKVEFRIELNKRLPYAIFQNAELQTLTLTVYGAQMDSALAEVVSTNETGKKIRCQQKENGEMHCTFEFNFKQQWGYRAFFDDTTLVIEIKHPDGIAKPGESVFRDIVICLDAGHSPDDGAIGPTGTREKDLTARYVLQLKSLLEHRGAKVILTRGDADGINLFSRTLFAGMAETDLFISLHFNALPDGVSPLRSRGVSTYYFHEHSFAFAEAIHKRLLQKTRLRDFDLRQNDLVVCRATSMPAVLLEPAFLMIPSEEMRILDPDFQSDVCEAIVQGIEDFLRHN